MHTLLRLAVATLLVALQTSGKCSQRILTAELLPGPDKWRELPDATFEVQNSNCGCTLHVLRESLIGGERMSRAYTVLYVANCRELLLLQVILEHEVVITVPLEKELKGVLFSLHGCLQLTKEWGFLSETCPGCHGKDACSALRYSHCCQRTQLALLKCLCWASWISLPLQIRYERSYEYLALLT